MSRLNARTVVLSLSAALICSSLILAVPATVSANRGVCKAFGCKVDSDCGDGCVCQKQEGNQNGACGT